MNNKVKNNKGFIFLEMIISLLIWLILFSTVIPSFLHLTYSRKELLIDHKASELLTNQAIHLIYDETFREVISETGYPVFTFSLRIENDWKEICVNYESRKNRYKQKCQKVQM